MEKEEKPLPIFNMRNRRLAHDFHLLWASLPLLYKIYGAALRTEFEAFAGMTDAVFY